ncbi:FMN-dependent NADH-azoreductase [Calothrix sp. 336/3]|uniref:FMN-dependent NADH-azoreductase n=1 Tax=Calothrix sp. 336/3 TaxID=1337936 RepID=UPI0004E44FFB|nr:FMN-dependent NADH-azoreductase [Calothrix sp. 336/3]AKG20894.1 FMN-dependent NADH-azoreductase [Calothrix sp. 336/3]
MANLLHIDASPRSQRSHSRRLSGEFVETWKTNHPHDTVTYRDVGRNPLPHIDEAWIAAAYSPPEQLTPELKEAIQLSDQLVDEFLAADIYVIGTPMYNFSIPSALKAYIDHIVRIGRTFAFTPEDSTNPYKPLVLGKKMFIIAARGGSGFSMGGQYELWNFQTPYLEKLFSFIGITDISLVEMENEEIGGEGLTEAIANARTQIAHLAAQKSTP